VDTSELEGMAQMIRDFQGVGAVLFLQSHVGLHQHPLQALAMWRDMSSHERELTMLKAEELGYAGVQ
jgi:hypothetical protein